MTEIYLPILSIINYFYINSYLSRYILYFDYRIRIISILHCLLVTFSSVFYLGNFLSDRIYLNLIYIISPGYFILDLKYLLSKSNGKNNLLQYSYYTHHIAALHIRCSANIWSFNAQVIGPPTRTTTFSRKGHEDDKDHAFSTGLRAAAWSERNPDSRRAGAERSPADGSLLNGIQGPPIEGMSCRLNPHLIQQGGLPPPGRR